MFLGLPKASEPRSVHCGPLTGATVSFHNFSLPEDRCVRLLVKNLGRHMPEDVVREELESLGICVHAVLQLRSGRRDQEATKDNP